MFISRVCAKIFIFYIRNFNLLIRSASNFFRQYFNCVIEKNNNFWSRFLLLLTFLRFASKNARNIHPPRNSLITCQNLTLAAISNLHMPILLPWFRQYWHGRCVDRSWNGMQLQIEMGHLVADCDQVCETALHFSNRNVLRASVCLKEEHQLGQCADCLLVSRC